VQPRYLFIGLKKYFRGKNNLLKIQDGVESADDAPDTAYYQWVTFMLLFQAGTFILPFNAWKHMEGGLIKVCLDYNYKKKHQLAGVKGPLVIHLLTTLRL